MNQKNKGILVYIAIPLLVVLMVFAVVSSSAKKTNKMYSEFLTSIESGEVAQLTLNLAKGDVEYLLRKDVAQYGVEKAPVYSYKVASSVIFEEDLEELFQKNPALERDMDYHYVEGNEGAWLLNMAPTALMLGVLIFFWVYMGKKMGGMGADKAMGFGKMKIRPQDNKKKTTFLDVAGADEEKEELRELVDFLKEPKKFNELGARIPKGVLLVGPPGTGKTLLARAVAGEAGVPFFSISGSDFVEMFVGVGASRVRDLFEQAKKNSPAIVFIDEIDAVGRQRGAGLGGGHDEREQTLNQLLVEMDGFGANEGVIIIAATNRPDVLDKALLRPGRFDRQVTVGYPDVKGREEILKVHSRGKPLGPDVSLKTIASATAGFTGADLENLLNEAALLAARKHKKAITQEEIEDATIKVVMGTEKKSHVITEKDKKITAYHEAGHAVVSFFLPTQDPVHQISIIPRGMAAGYTMYVPTDDNQHVSKNKLTEDICSLLGGRAAEELTQDDICTGASNDIQRATEIAKKMVTKYGMSDKVGPVCLGNDREEVFLGRDFSNNKDYSEKYASMIDEEISNIVNGQYNRAVEIIKANMGKLHKVAQILFVEEKIDGERFIEVMNAGE